MLVIVAEHGGVLATRDKGRQLLVSVQEHLYESAESQLVIDFSGIEAMTYPFAAEFVGRLYAGLLHDAYPSVTEAWVRGATGDTEETIDVCLARRGLVAMAMCAPRRRPFLLGDIEFLGGTYNTAVTLGEFTAADIAATLDITVQNANNRLRRLLGARAVTRRRIPVARRRGGSEFRYSIPNNGSEGAQPQQPPRDQETPKSGGW